MISVRKILSTALVGAFALSLSTGILAPVKSEAAGIWKTSPAAEAAAKQQNRAEQIIALQDEKASLEKAIANPMAPTKTKTGIFGPINSKMVELSKARLVEVNKQLAKASASDLASAAALRSQKTKDAGIDKLVDLLQEKAALTKSLSYPKGIMGPLNAKSAQNIKNRIAAIDAELAKADPADLAQAKQKVPDWRQSIIR